MNESQRKPLNDSEPGSSPLSSPREEDTNLQARLATKDRWKNQPGHRYTPDEKKQMTEAAEVKIHRRKRVVMRF